MAQKAATYFDKQGRADARPADYVVFYVEAWGRWVGCVNLSELLRRDTSTGGYLGICTGFSRTEPEPAPGRFPGCPAHNDREGVHDMTKFALNPWHPMDKPIDLKHLGKLGEECGELSSAVSRCIIQGIDESEPVTHKPNREWLEDEIADVVANIELVSEHFQLDQDRMADLKNADANHHIRAVQTLNSFFDVGDTAEQDDERAKAPFAEVSLHYGAREGGKSVARNYIGQKKE